MIRLSRQAIRGLGRIFQTKSISTASALTSTVNQDHKVWTTLINSDKILHFRMTFYLKQKSCSYYAKI